MKASKYGSNKVVEMLLAHPSIDTRLFNNVRKLVFLFNFIA